MKRLLGFAVSGVLIVLLIVTLDWKQVAHALRGFDLMLLAPLTALLALHYLLRAIRWRYLLPSNHYIGTKALFDSLMVGNLATYLLPLRAGEFIRPYMLTLSEPLSFSRTFASVVIERFFDLACVLLQFALLVRIMPDLPTFAFKGAFILGLLAFGILALMITGSFLPDLTRRAVARCARSLPENVRSRLDRLVGEFLEGAAVLRSPRRLVMVMLLTAAVWMSGYYLFLQFLSMVSVPISWSLGLALSVIIALAVAAPSMPGFVGVYQYACITAFTLYGHSQEVGAAYGLLTHAYQYLIFIAYGSYALFSRGLSLSTLRAQLKSRNGAH